MNYLELSKAVSKEEREKLLGPLPIMQCYKKDSSAVLPFKSRFSDVGFDLTLIKLEKVNGKTHYYDTGLVAIPPNGHYFSIEERSSAHKKGIHLRNKRGIIDPEYRGTLIVALDYDDGVEKLSLPAVVVQLIPHKLILMEMVEVDAISKTTRNDQGGLGSAQFN